MPEFPLPTATLACDAQVIDRRVRELAVECDLLPLETPAAELTDYAAIIVSGGPQSVYAADAPKYDKEIFQLGVPLLGICYGLQLLNHALGGSVEKKSRREDGAFKIGLDTSCALFDGLSETTEVLLTHGDSVSAVPEGFRVVATSGELVAAIEDEKRQLYGVQFHPEVDLSVDGTAMIKNFLFGVVGLSGSYSAACRQDLAIEYIKKEVGETKKVLCLVSGGVDSSVCAALIHKAIGAERLICLHIDHGFMRHEESATVVKALEALGVPIEALDATDTFAAATTDIKGVQTKPLGETVAPEEKRKIIGDTFMVVTQVRRPCTPRHQPPRLLSLPHALLLDLHTPYSHRRVALFSPPRGPILTAAWPYSHRHVALFSPPRGPILTAPWSLGICMCATARRCVRRRVSRRRTSSSPRAPSVPT